jgi:hypothetical protein
MDWIEHLFRVSPDHGNGTLELAIYLVVLAVVGWAIGRRTRAFRRWRGAKRSRLELPTDREAAQIPPSRGS